LNFSPYDDWHENCNLKGVNLNPGFLFAPVGAAFIPTLAGSAGRMEKMGKAGKNAFGFYGAHDRINNLLFPSDQGYLPASPTTQP